MRIISFLITSIIILAVLLVGGGLLARESLMVLGTSSVRSSLTILHQLSRDNLQFARQCREKGGNNSDVATIGGLQLRFLDNRNYVIEVICNQFQSDPIVIERYSLPMFVTKSPGSSGIIWGNDRSAVQIESFGRKEVLGVEGEEVKSYAAGSVDLGITPISTCAGYGHQCCQQETTAGQGLPFTGVVDCPKNCYSACQPRPIFLSLNTDPFMDELSRITDAKAGEPMTFSYVASFDVKTPITITIDFGDGQQETFSTLTGKASHQYACLTASCTYQVKLSAKAANNIEAAQTPIMSMKARISQ